MGEEAEDLSDLFQIEVEMTPKVEKESVKWSIGKTKHELYVPLLTKMDVASIVEHLVQVKTMIDTRVGTDDYHRFLSYKNVIPMTFCVALRAVWDVNLVDNAYKTEDVKGFEATLRLFIAAHCDEQDRHELYQLLQQSRKPVNMDVMAYYARLRTLNGYLNWLPIDDPPALSSAQLSQAFHDGMPEKWRVLYRNAGRSARKDTQAELQRFFRKQQSAASRSMRANQKGQKAAARSRSKSNRKEASGRFNDRSLGKKKKDSKFRTKGKSTDKNSMVASPMTPRVPSIPSPITLGVNVRETTIAVKTPMVTKNRQPSRTSRKAKQKMPTSTSWSKSPSTGTAATTNTTIARR